jgi:hypothetical protein
LSTGLEWCILAICGRTISNFTETCRVINNIYGMSLQGVLDVKCITHVPVYYDVIYLAAVNIGKVRKNEWVHIGDLLKPVHSLACAYYRVNICIWRS